jgi:predicted metal-dependent peptidase
MPTTLERIADARVWLNTRVPFLGYMTLKLRPRLATEHDMVPTAGVAPDGTLVINDEFAKSLDDAELRFVMCHEVLHPALGFWARKKTRDALGFNVAHDYAINLIIDAFAKQHPNHLRMPKVGLLDQKYDGMSAEEIYDALPKKGSGGGGMGGDCRGDLSESQDGREAGKGDQGAQTKLDKDWRTHTEAARQVHETALGRGSLPAGVQKILDELLDPKVHWSTVLSQWIGENAGKQDFTYQRPARRSESAGELLPGVLRTDLPDVTILWDTSGSMTGQETAILSEVADIVDELGLTIRLIVCDCAIYADVDKLDNIEAVVPHVKGGGGSDFSPAFDRLTEEGNTSVVIAFTDGYIGVPQTQPEALKGVLWVITDRGQRPASWGRAIMLDKDGYVEEA